MRCWSRGGGGLLTPWRKRRQREELHDGGSPQTLREVVPPPYRLGVSNPDPCRLFADRGARLAVVFIRLELCKRLWNVRASAGSVGARHE